MLRRILRSTLLAELGAALFVLYLRFVFLTSRLIVLAPQILERSNKEWPIIVSAWHGDLILTPFVKPKDKPLAALVSRSRDGTYAERIVRRLGLSVIRGSGSVGPQVARKGGAPAVRQMLRALDRGTGVALTADIPKVARKAGLGAIILSRMSGKPIYPISVIPSRRRVFHKSWDRSFIPFPFGRIVFCLGEPLQIAPESSEEQLEASRHLLQKSMENVTARAYAEADKNARQG